MPAATGLLIMDANEQIIAWLRDAHAMEQALAGVLQRHIEDAQDFPALRERLKHHLDESRDHGERVRECLHSLGAKPSTAKSLAGTFMGAVQGMATAAFADEILKNALADYAMEHFEIACYTSLLSAVEQAGMVSVAVALREILAEEQAMADWFRNHLPQLTHLHLEQAATRIG